jgi:hypothetical protein
MILKALFNYDKIARNRCARLVRLFFADELKHFDHSNKMWGRHQVICTRLGNFVRWCFDGPQKGFIS